MFIRTAIDDVVIDPNMSEQEIDQAEAELFTKAKKEGPFWDRVVRNLLAKSSSQEIDTAVKEWRFTRAWSNHSACQLCGHTPIKFHFEIENRVTHKSLIVGSECIYNYLEIPGAPDRAILRRRLNQLRNKIRDVEKGKALEGEIGELQELQGLERELNIRIDSLGPERQLNIEALFNELAPGLKHAVLLRLETPAYKSVLEAAKALRILQGFLLNICKRSKKCDPRDLRTAVLAIMNFREPTQGKRKLLDSFQKYLADAFNYGRPKDLVQTLGREIAVREQELKDERIQDITEQGRAVQQDLEKRFLQPLLSDVKPYANLLKVVNTFLDLCQSRVQDEVQDLKRQIQRVSAVNTINLRVSEAVKVEYTCRFSAAGKNYQAIVNLFDHFNDIVRELTVGIQQKWVCKK